MEKKGFFSKLFGGKCGCSSTSGEVKKTEPKCSCGCNFSEKYEVRILGGGCKNCHTLEENTVAALNELSYSFTLEHITDYAEIAKYGIMSTPGLWINGNIVSFGKVLSKEEVKTILLNLK